MAYATQEQLKYLSDHMTVCRKHGYNKYRMLVESDSNESGKKNAQIMQSIYPEGALKDNSGGYRDFSIEFTYNWQRDQAVTDINTMVGGYRQQHFMADTVSNDSAELPTDGSCTSVTAVTDSVSGYTSGQNSNTATYVVLGVAVVIIALLLLWKPSKGGLFKN